MVAKVAATLAIVLLVTLLSISTTLAQYPGSYPGYPGYPGPYQYDWHTGNTQLHQAANAAIARLVTSGELENLTNFYTPEAGGYVNLPDPFCVYAPNQATQIFQFPTNPAGTLKNILTRGYWIMAATRINNGANGDYTVNPPTGLLPAINSALARIIGQNYGVNLTVQYYLSDAALGSAQVFYNVLNNVGGSDSTQTNFLLTGTLSLPNSTRSYIRSDIIQGTCSVQTSPIYVQVLNSSGITNNAQLVSYVQSHPGVTIAAFESGDQAAASAAYQGANVVDYVAKDGFNFNNAVNDAVNDLYSGAVIAIFDDGDPTLVNTTYFLSSVTAPSGLFTRYDDYSPDYAQACEAGLEILCGHPPPDGHGPPGEYNDDDDSTTINFYFADMLASGPAPPLSP